MVSKISLWYVKLLLLGTLAGYYFWGVSENMAQLRATAQNLSSEVTSYGQTNAALLKELQEMAHCPQIFRSEKQSLNTALALSQEAQMLEFSVLDLEQTLREQAIFGWAYLSTERYNQDFLRVIKTAQAYHSGLPQKPPLRAGFLPVELWKSSLAREKFILQSLKKEVLEKAKAEIAASRPCFGSFSSTAKELARK